jgi:hypothetical protein
MLVAPVMTTVTTGQPLLIWTTDTHAVDYVVKVADDKGATIWQKTTAQTSLTYNGTSALKPNVKYSWDVTPRYQSAPGAVEEAT